MKPHTTFIHDLQHALRRASGRILSPLRHATRPGLLFALLTLALPLAVAGQTFTVNATSDDPDATRGDGVCATIENTCTLRAAIQEANAFDGADSISFAIPNSDIGCDSATGVCTIAPATALPSILEQVVIDGTTQPGADCATMALTVELDGTFTTDVEGLRINAGGGGSLVRGLAIYNYDLNGLHIGNSSNNRIACNIIGTNSAGASGLGNAGAGGVAGLQIYGGAATTNIIGTDGDGVDDALEGNVISGNARNGVVVQLGKDNVIAGNFIGTLADGTTALGNAWRGVVITNGARRHQIGGLLEAEANTIAHNGRAGVYLADSNVIDGNAVLGNRIFSNGELGIDLGSTTANDADDDNAGANQGQNSPVLTVAVLDPADNLTLAYQVDTAPANAAYPLRVEFFLADADGEEGAALTGSTSYTLEEAQTEVTVTFTPSSSVAGGDLLVATATDADGNTSEFSAAFELVLDITESLVVTTTVDEDDGTSDPAYGAGTSLREAIAFANANPDSSVITFDSGVTGTINLSGALPDLSTDLEIQGPGANVLTVRRDTGGGYRIFTVAGGATVTLSGLTIANGRAGKGGGILNDGTLTIEYSTITGNEVNSGNDGGGILNTSAGTLTVRNSTLSDNSAFDQGGGIANAGTLTVENTTISNNYGNLQGGGLYNSGGTATIRHSTFSGNDTISPGASIRRTGGTVIVFNTIFERSTSYANLWGAITSLGYNLCDDACGLSATGDQTSTDPLLGALADNGGPTQTHLPAFGSPVIDAGSCAGLTTDQRGLNRPMDDATVPDVDDGCDIGAVEIEQNAAIKSGGTSGGEALAGSADAVPQAYALQANYPNPFNPKTTIGFDLPAAGQVRLVVYDALGREVARLVEGSLEAGKHTARFDAGALPSGLYVYRLEAGTFSQTRTMLLVK